MPIERIELQIAQRRVLEVGGRIVAQQRLAGRRPRARRSPPRTRVGQRSSTPAAGRAAQTQSALLGQVDRGRVGADHGLHARDEVGPGCRSCCGARAPRPRAAASRSPSRPRARPPRVPPARRAAPPARAAGAGPLGEVPDEGREHDLVADLHAMEGLLGREGGPVPAPQLELAPACTLSGSVALHQLADAAASWPSSALLREDHAARRLADRLGRRPAEQALGGGVPGRDQAGVRRRSTTNASGAVSSRRRMRASLWRSSRVRASAAAASRPDPREQAGDQQPGHGGGADRRAASAAAGPSWIASTTA